MRFGRFSWWLSKLYLIGGKPVERLLRADGCPEYSHV
jgi:hypothetical protein